MHVQRTLHNVQTLQAITETTTHSQIVLQCNDVWHVGEDVDTMSWMMFTFSIFTLAVPPPKSVGGGPTRARQKPSSAYTEVSSKSGVKSRQTSESNCHPAPTNASIANFVAKSSVFAFVGYTEKLHLETDPHDVDLLSFIPLLMLTVDPHWFIPCT